MPTDRLKGVTNYGDSSLSDQIFANTKAYFDWGFLQVGAFNNVILASSGGYGGNESALRPVSLNGYDDGQVWDAFRKNWVWESGTNYAVTPITISGVWVDGTLNRSGFAVDYPNGHIIFDSGRSVTSAVALEYSYKRVLFTTVDAEEFRQVESHAFTIDSDFTLGSGMYPERGRNLVELPIVGIEVVPQRTFPMGIQLGGGHYMDQDIVFRIYAETSSERNKIFDLISSQKDTTFYLFDLNDIAASGTFPLDSNGAIANQHSCNYGNLVNPAGPYYWRNGTFIDFTGQEQPTLQRGLYGGIARGKLRIGMPEI